MPRARRVLIEGGLYHVYNRFARGEEVIADPEEAVTFLDLLRELKPSAGRPYVDELGRSTGPELAQLDADVFVELACNGLGIDATSLTGRIEDRKTTRLRQLVATVGIERWEQRAGKLGHILGKHPDVVSRWARTGAERRSSDPDFAEKFDRLDATRVESCHSQPKIV
jgi:hypothetical protein